MGAWLSDLGLWASWKSVTIWVTTTIASGLCGILLGIFFQRAKPRVNIENVEISSSYHDMYTIPRVNVPASDAIQRIIANKWYMCQHLRRPTAILEDLVNELKAVDNVLTQVTQELRELAKCIDQMIALLGHSRHHAIADRFIDLWEPNNRVILNALLPAIVRGDDMLPNVPFGPERENPVAFLSSQTLEEISRTWFPGLDANKPEQEQEPRPLLVSRIFTPEQHFPMFVVRKRGGVLPVYVQPFSEEEVLAAAYVAFSLANFDRNVLESMLHFLKRQIEAIETPSVALGDAKNLLKANSRWVITTTLVNSGANSVTFSGRALMRVDTRRVVETHASGWKRMRWRTKGSAGDIIEIPLQNRNERKEIQPETLSGRQGTVARFSSVELVNGVKDWEYLLQLFEGTGNGSVQIELEANPVFWFGNLMIKSELARFSPELGGEGAHRVLSPSLEMGG